MSTTTGYVQCASYGLIVIIPCISFSFPFIVFSVEDVPDGQCNKGTPCVCDPSTQPSSQPSEVPSESSFPSSQPSMQPSSQPSSDPTLSSLPSFDPTSSLVPSLSSSNKPSSTPSPQPSESFVPSCSKCFPPGIDVCGNTFEAIFDGFEIPFDAEVGCGSCSGDFACAGASGIIGDKSCFESRACYQFGYTFATQGDTKNPEARSLQELKEPIIFPPFPPIKVEGSSIGESSCLGESACDSASGTIGSSSCIGTNACSFVPFKLGDGGIGGESELFTTFPKLAQGDIIKQKGSILFQNEQVLEGEKYASQITPPFTRSLEEIQQPSIGDNSCSGSSACELNIGNIGDASCTKGFDGNEPPSCIDNRGRIGNGSCTEHASCIGNRGRIGNGSW